MDLLIIKEQLEALFRAAVKLLYCFLHLLLLRRLTLIFKGDRILEEGDLLLILVHILFHTCNIAQQFGLSLQYQHECLLLLLVQIGASELDQRLILFHRVTKRLQGHQECGLILNWNGKLRDVACKLDSVNVY